VSMCVSCKSVLCVGYVVSVCGCVLGGIQCQYVTKMGFVCVCVCCSLCVGSE